MTQDYSIKKNAVCSDFYVMSARCPRSSMHAETGDTHIQAFEMKKD